MLYVGVDAHKNTSQITVMNEAGVILGSWLNRHTPLNLSFGRLPPDPICTPDELMGGLA